MRRAYQPGLAVPARSGLTALNGPPAVQTQRPVAGPPATGRVMPGGAAARRRGCGGRTCDLPIRQDFCCQARFCPVPALPPLERPAVKRVGTLLLSLACSLAGTAALATPAHALDDGVYVIRDLATGSCLTPGARNVALGGVPAVLGAVHPLACRERAPGPGHPRRPHQLRPRPQMPRPRPAEQADCVPVRLPAAVVRADGRRCAQQAAQRRDRAVRHHSPRQQRHPPALRNGDHLALRASPARRRAVPCR